MLKAFLDFLSENYPDTKFVFNDVGSIAIQFPDDPKHNGKGCFANWQQDDGSVEIHCIHCKTDEHGGEWFFRRVYDAEFYSITAMENGVKFMMESDISTASLQELYKGCHQCFAPENGNDEWNEQQIYGSTK